jgi:hypothetical protein
MDNSSEVRAFLTSRRAKVSPEQAGIPAYGNRRVAGLRRGEVAALAGVSVEYYTRLERGNLGGASESVLDALARALRLDDTETAHLHHLARAAGPIPVRSRARRGKAPEIRAAVRRVLDSMTGVPAFLRNHRFDILAANPLGMALYAPLSMRSEPFRGWWAAQDVYVHQHGTKRFRHPAIGELDLAFEMLELPGDDALMILTYSAERGTPAGDGLELLATWAATQPKTSTAPAKG